MTFFSQIGPKTDPPDPRLSEVKFWKLSRKVAKGPVLLKKFAISDFILINVYFIAYFYKKSDIFIVLL